MLARKKATLHKGQGQYSVCRVQRSSLMVTGELEGFVEFQSCISMATNRGGSRIEIKRGLSSFFLPQPPYSSLSSFFSTSYLL